MSKSADAFRTISEVAEWMDTPAHVLRFWESKFTQVKPVKRAGGRRYYRPADMRLLGGIKKLLHEDGMTIKGAQKVLREQGVKHVSSLCTLSFGDDEDVALADGPNSVVSEPVDTIVPFSKPEEKPEPAAAEDVAELDLVAEAPVAETEPTVEAVAPDGITSHDALEPPEPAEPPASVEVTPTQSKDTTQDSEDAHAFAKADATVEAAAPDTDIAKNRTNSDEAEGLPGFLQHSMAERSAESHSDSGPDDQSGSLAGSPEPDEPMPGTLTHLSRITNLSPELARQIAPVLERLRDVAR